MGIVVAIYFIQNQDGIRDDGMAGENYSASLATLKAFFLNIFCVKGSLHLLIEVSFFHT